MQCNEYSCMTKFNEELFRTRMYEECSSNKFVEHLLSPVLVSNVQEF